MPTYATTRVNPAPLGNAALVLEKTSCGIIHRLSGGSTGARVIETRVPGSVGTSKHLGPTEHEDFSLDFDFAMGRPLFDWIAATWAMKAPRIDGVILACDRTLTPRSQRKFFGALISETTIPALDVTNRDTAWLNLKFAVEETQLESASGGRVSGDPGHAQKRLQPASFRLEIEGLDCTLVRAIDSFTVTQSLHRIQGLRAELVPGTVAFPNLKITFAEVAVESWQTWHEDFVVQGNHSSEKEKKGTLTLLSPDKSKTLAVIYLHGLGIFNLSHAAVEGDLDEQHMLATAELYCQRMDFGPGT